MQNSLEQRVQARVHAEQARAAMTAAQRAQGLAYARAWRARNKPVFDALYGAERCACGAERG